MSDVGKRCTIINSSLFYFGREGFIEGDNHTGRGYRIILDGGQRVKILKENVLVFEGQQKEKNGMSDFKINDEVVVVGKTCSTFGQVGRVVRTRVGHRCDKVSITINGTNVFTMLPHNLEHMKDKNSAPVVDHTLDDVWPKVMVSVNSDEDDVGHYTEVQSIFSNFDEDDLCIKLVHGIKEIREYIEEQLMDWEHVVGIIDGKTFTASSTVKYAGIDI